MPALLARARAACVRGGRAVRAWAERAGRRRVALILAPIVGAGVAAAALGPIAAARARSTAARYGLELSVADVDLGLGRIWLKGVQLKAPDMPALSIQVDAVAVAVGPTLSVSSVLAYGGQVRLRGSAEQLEEQFQRWRARLPRGSGSSGAGREREIAAQGIDVSWVDVDRAAATAVWGVRYERAVREVLAADLVRGGSPYVRVAAQGPEIVLGRRGGARVVERFSVRALDTELILDDEAPSGARTKKLPGVPAPPSASATATPGERLRARAAWLARTLDGAVASSGELELSGLHARLRQGDQVLNIGPARFELRRQGPMFDVKFVAGGRQTPMALALRLPLGEGPVAFELAGGPVSLAALGIKEGDFGLRRIDQAEIEAKGGAILSADGKTLGLGTSGRLSRLSVYHPRLAADPVQNIELSWRASGEAATDGTRARIDVGELTVARARLELKGELTNTPERFALALDGGVPLASCQDMFASLPAGIAPRLSGLQMTGTFSLSGKLRFDSLRPADVESRVSFVNGCHVTAVPAAISPRRFASTFSYEAKDESGQSVRIYTGPDTPSWTRYELISRYMEAALLINEDGRFFHHRGFDQEAISNSLEENIKARRFVRGASTITMQLAKNLYLERDKTLSRKLSEAVLTMLLEQELTKQQILELYLNVIEFGPGIYGIGAAARYYFNTTPAQLSLGQALYLGSILPNPKQSHFGKDGNVTPRWSAYLRKLMQIARKRELINDQELELGLSEQVGFRAGTGAGSGAADGGAPNDAYDEAAFMPDQP